MIDSSKWARMLSENNLSRKENFKKKTFGRGRFNSRGTNQRQNPSKDTCGNTNNTFNFFMDHERI